MFTSSGASNCGMDMMSVSQFANYVVFDPTTWETNND